MISINQRVALGLMLSACLAGGSARAQSKYSRKSSGKTYTKTQSSKNEKDELAEKLSSARADLVDATKDYKASLEKLIPLYDADVKKAADLLDKRKQLLPLGAISKRELEDTERALTNARLKVDEIRRQLSQADDVVAEADAADRLAREQQMAAGAYYTTAGLIRFNGTGEWALSLATKVETFFSAKFSHALPVSAFGQTAVHNRLGFDHHNAIDVAVHPDSVEGQGLMSFLRAAGIPFIAFRTAVAGSATGAHIHIGQPSHRIPPANQ